MIAATSKCCVVPKVAARNQVVAHAAHADRRAVMGGLVAAVVALTADKASALSDIDLFDDRKAKQNGFDLIYEARDVDLPQNQRDGITQFRGDLKLTKERVNESTRRINETVSGFVAKAYWTRAKEEMRLQVGNMRMDVATLASAKGNKADKKAALALGKTFFDKANDFDFAMRQKDQSKADAAFAEVQSSLSALNAVIIG